MIFSRTSSEVDSQGVPVFVPASTTEASLASRASSMAIIETETADEGAPMTLIAFLDDTRTVMGCVGAPDGEAWHTAVKDHAGIKVSSRMRRRFLPLSEPKGSW